MESNLTGKKRKRFCHGYVKSGVLTVLTATVLHSLKSNFYINESSQIWDILETNV